MDTKTEAAGTLERFDGENTMTESNRNQRKFSNIKLTQQYHYHHMGLWVLITISLVILINYLLFALILQQWGYSSGMGIVSGSFATQVGAVLAIEATLLSIAIVLMAKTTSHRISGAFLAIQKTCDTISAGELDTRQHFRDYDKLEDLEKSINNMLDKLCGQQSSSSE
jgi:methyl-accepting chemotaxis protein